MKDNKSSCKKMHVIWQRFYLIETEYKAVQVLVNVEKKDQKYWKTKKWCGIGKYRGKFSIGAGTGGSFIDGLKS